MASRYFTQLQTMGTNRVRVGGQFRTGASGAGDTIISTKGQGWVVQNLSPGIFLIDFDDFYTDAEEWEITIGVQNETPLAVSAQMLVNQKVAPDQPYWYSTITLFQGNPLTIGTVADCVVNFNVVFVNTGITSQ